MKSYSEDSTDFQSDPRHKKGFKETLLETPYFSALYNTFLSKTHRIIYFFHNNPEFLTYVFPIAYNVSKPYPFFNAELNSNLPHSWSHPQFYSDQGKCSPCPKSPKHTISNSTHGNYYRIIL